MPVIQVSPFSTDREQRQRLRDRRRARTQVLERSDDNRNERRTASVIPTENQQDKGVFSDRSTDDSLAVGGGKARTQQQSTMDAMSTGQAAYLRKVYGVTGSTLGIASIGMLGGLMFPISPLITGFGSLVPLIGLYMTKPNETHPAIRWGLLGTFAGLSGMSAGPLIGMSLQMDPLILPMALMASGGIFAGATLASFVAPKGKMLALGAPLMGGCFVLFGLGILGIFYPHPMFYNIQMYGGLALFTAFIAYDTHQILEDYDHGARDPLTHATSLFINFMAIFKRMLLLFMNRDD